jgi:hypothetical protein
MKRFLYTMICVAMMSSCNNEIDLAGREGTFGFQFLDNDFSGVSVQDGFELYLVRERDVNGVRSDTTVRIESDENVIRHIKHEIRNGILYFYKTSDVEFPSSVRVRISVAKDSLVALNVLSSKVQIVDTLRTNMIHLVCSDQGSLSGRLECKKIQSAINNSTVELTGVSDTIQMDIDAGSFVKLFKLESNNAKVYISGGSIAEVAVNNELEVKADGHSILYYQGETIIRSLILDDKSEIRKTPR